MRVIQSVHMQRTAMCIPEAFDELQNHEKITEQNDIPSKLKLSYARGRYFA